MLLVIRRWLILIVGGKGRSLRLQGLLIVVDEESKKNFATSFPPVNKPRELKDLKRDFSLTLG